MMDSKHLAVADMLDIVFDGRNKAYGAYQLRRSYNKRMATAMGLVIFTTSLIFVSSMLANGVKTHDRVLVNATEVTLSDFKETPIPPPPVVTPPPVQQVRTLQVTPPIIMPDPEVNPEDMLPPVEEIETARIGTVTQGGEDFTGIVEPPVEKVGTGLAEAPPVKAEDENIVWKKVEIPAEFPGGLNEWRRYLEKNLMYPEAAVENGREAQVRVQFIVDKEGNISEVRALNDPGDGLAEEAIRIIKKGPKWRPAEQNGRKVNYQHIQSITFKLG